MRSRDLLVRALTATATVDSPMTFRLRHGTAAPITPPGSSYTARVSPVLLVLLVSLASLATTSPPQPASPWPETLTPWAHESASVVETTIWTFANDSAASGE